MNMELEFHVVKQSIKRTDGNAPVSDSVNYLTAEFNFDSSDWDNTTKTATFRNNGTVYTVILDANGKCVVPWEIIENGKMKVSVYGDGANDYRITADTVEVAILASGYSEGEESQQPTPTQYEQLAGIISTKSSVVVNPAESATGTANKIKVDGVTYAISGGGGGGAVINDTTASTTSVYSSSKVQTLVNGKSTVVANPTLEGTETALNGLEIDGIKYKFPTLPLAESQEV